MGLRGLRRWLSWRTLPPRRPAGCPSHRRRHTHPERPLDHCYSRCRQRRPHHCCSTVPVQTPQRRWGRRTHHTRSPPVRQHSTCRWRPDPWSSKRLGRPGAHPLHSTHPVPTSDRHTTTTADTRCRCSPCHTRRGHSTTAVTHTHRGSSTSLCGSTMIDKDRTPGWWWWVGRCRQQRTAWRSHRSR